jgi:hypothetical protein
MIWEGRRLRDIREADVRNLIQSGLAEHLELEYKSALYEDNDRGRREFLQDVCMFAIANGCVILIGIREARDEEGQAAGVPDQEADLGIEVPNPEAVLSAYDARVMESIEERLALESSAIEVGGGRRVLAIRVPNSTNKPHSVRYQGHVYFTSRRERQRYNLSVREIKELVMRTASRLQQAEERLKEAFAQVERPTDEPYLLVGLVPVFSDDFLVDVRGDGIRMAVGNVSRTSTARFSDPLFNFHGIERRENQYEHKVLFSRSGLLLCSQKLPLIPRQDNQHSIGPVAIEQKWFTRRRTSLLLMCLG